jgi:hypothetical protein
MKLLPRFYVGLMTVILYNCVFAQPIYEATIGGKKSPDGTVEIACDLPGDLQRHNTESVGLGMCVFVSIHHAATWQNAEVYENIHEWMKSKRIPGGGYPKKVDKILEEIAKDRGMEKVDYINYEGNDIDLLILACKTGRMPCVTYSYSFSGRYGGGRIYHMVNLVYADDKWFCILDNNFPGEDKYEWLTKDEFIKTYTGMKTGWCVILLNPPPPPPPKN